MAISEFLRRPSAISTGTATLLEDLVKFDEAYDNPDSTLLRGCVGDETLGTVPLLCWEEPATATGDSGGAVFLCDC